MGGDQADAQRGDRLEIHFFVRSVPSSVIEIGRAAGSDKLKNGMLKRARRGDEFGVRQTKP